MDTAREFPEQILAVVRCLEAGRHAEAEALCRRVLAETPRDPDVLAGLAALARRSGLRGLAVALADLATRCAPASAELHDLLGQLLNEAGDYEASVRAFERVLTLDPVFPASVDHLARARHDLAIARDPDYASVPGAPWSAADSIWEELAGNRTLLVLFAGLGIGAAAPTFIFRKFLAPCTGVDKLFVRDTTRSWYQLGLPGVTGDVASTAAYLRQRRAAYDRTLFLGCSAGGMAAMLYGELAGADRVLAFAPQTVLSERKPDDLHDHRWEPALTRLRASVADGRFLDLPGLGPLASAVDIYYPVESTADRAHAEAVAGPRVRRFPQPGASHVIALEMRDDGRLKSVVDAALA
jgi:hypothetical protein